MKNNKNKFVAGVVCGLIVGSIGTSFVGKFQANKQQIGLNTNDNLYSNGETPPFSQEDMPQRPEGMPGGKNGRGGYHQGQGSLEATDSIDVFSGQYNDGTYQGTSDGYAQGLTVDVKIASGKISNIEITSHNETPGFYEKAFEIVPTEIIKKQSTDVDTVSGATYSSVGIINAVNSALSQANKTQSDSTTDSSKLNTKSQ